MTEWLLTVILLVNSGGGVTTVKLPDRQSCEEVSRILHKSYPYSHAIYTGCAKITKDPS